MKYLFLVFGLYFSAFYANGQAQTRKLSSSINHPSLNLYSPYLSADANALVFISDNAEDGVLTPFYTFREVSDWREPQLFPKHIQSRLNFLRGYSLSADGKRLYFTTLKGPGVGGFDIWYSDLKGTSWSEPGNFGLPLNTKAHEGCPTFTTDGNTVYFMRCEKMDQNKGENCRILKSTKKPNGQWEEPVELPSNINTGNSQTPRIMADGETLYFSSDKLSPKKGGMDLYVTRLVNGKWTDPKPLDFINTDKDDQYISVAALGRYILKDTQGPRKNELVEFLIPESLRPKGIMKVEGSVTDPAGKAVSAYISAFDVSNNKRVYNAKPAADGSFYLYLKEGSRYEISFDPEQNNLTYYSRIFDLNNSDKIPQVEKLKATLKALVIGDELNLDRVQFNPSSSELMLTEGVSEWKRLVRVINGNPSFKFDIQVLQTGYLEDTIPSNPDLTEAIYDSVTTQYDDIDSLGQLYKRDTIIVKTIYHNNRTTKQAKAIADYLISLGASKDRISYFGNSIPATSPDNRRLVIKAVVKK
ncbi:hypothetical protein [Chryseosolibacter indicus]|uniref:PD40 domain-containing protein n=1 Tax=Chryseosolibacter indicus TaxID=2782351 RepID=A0ABS5VS00_9BACT|nr:hypothetical protein [Chryseosolibacter indicus]MBT1704214.1 PD40 domain-containing protein [Chryseosolibacter indicus]